MDDLFNKNYLFEIVSIIYSNNRKIKNCATKGLKLQPVFHLNRNV